MREIEKEIVCQKKEEIFWSSVVSIVFVAIVAVVYYYG